MPVAVRLIEFLTIVTLFVLILTGTLLLLVADKVIFLIGIIVKPVIELVQITLTIMEYLFYWSIGHLMKILSTLGSCGGGVPRDE